MDFSLNCCAASGPELVPAWREANKNIVCSSYTYMLALNFADASLVDNSYWASRQHCSSSLFVLGGLTTPTFSEWLVVWSVPTQIGVAYCLFHPVLAVQDKVPLILWFRVATPSNKKPKL